MNFWQSTANCQNHMKIYGTNEENEITNNNKKKSKKNYQKQNNLKKRRCQTVYLKVFCLTQKHKTNIFAKKIKNI